ncbi:hypothetical protein ENTCAN_09541 [Enterobacter cancerogenus ATCC 35316]|nr:hypothetical protein ENTCAN_09541 [Enterobacter cancerogenus ATCC 35316]
MNESGQRSCREKDAGFSCRGNFQPIFGWAFFSTNKLISRAFFV